MDNYKKYIYSCSNNLAISGKIVNPPCVLEIDLFSPTNSSIKIVNFTGQGV